MDALGALNVLRLFVKAHGSQKAASEALGISEPYMVDLLKGRRPLTDKVLNGLGLAKQIVIRKKVSA